ncbi:hypothetical protein GGR58DRAFT_414900 [Xylaria digitata]|nr:hypothetical protein GGR58DRAFT_414900 [Xylaria digitata]
MAQICSLLVLISPFLRNRVDPIPVHISNHFSRRFNYTDRHSLTLHFDACQRRVGTTALIFSLVLLSESDKRRRAREGGYSKARRIYRQAGIGGKQGLRLRY